MNPFILICIILGAFFVGAIFGMGALMVISRNRIGAFFAERRPNERKAD